MKNKKQIELEKQMNHIFRGPVTVHILEGANPDPWSVFVTIDDPTSLDFGECERVSLACLEEVEQNEN